MSVKEVAAVVLQWRERERGLRGRRVGFLGCEIAENRIPNLGRIAINLGSLD